MAKLPPFQIEAKDLLDILIEQDLATDRVAEIRKTLCEVYDKGFQHGVEDLRLKQ